MKDIGEILFERRRELGLTKQYVAQAVGVAKSTVSKWEDGSIKNVGRDNLMKLAQVLQINPSEILSIPESEIPNEDQQIIEAMHSNPALRTLFHKQKTLNEEDLGAVLAIVNAIARERDGNG